MSSVSSTSSSTASYSSKGLSGLVSGLDTDSMVEKLLQGTQTKIDKQEQQKQQIEWKQAMYRDIITKINTFRDSYFDSAYDSTLTTNLSSSNFFNTMVSTVSSGSSVKIVSTDSSASAGETSVLVSQLASAAKLTAGVKMSGTQKITGAAMDLDAIQSRLESGEDLTFDLVLDGVSKTITFSSGDFSGEITADTVKTALDTKVKSAFGTYISADMEDDKLSFSIHLLDSNGEAEPGHELRITGADAADFGITPGSTSLLSTSTELGDITGVSGGSYQFRINGVEFEFSSGDTVSTMMKQINASNAGVKISYSKSADQFKIEAASTGAQYGIDIQQGTGNLLSVLFGADQISQGSRVMSDTLNTSSVAGTALDDDYTIDEAAMSFRVNGTSYTFSLAKKDGAYTKSEIETKFNDWLKTKFGESGGTANISYSDGKLNTAAGYVVSFAKTGIDTTDPDIVALAAKTDLSVAMGFSLTGATNAVTGDTELSEVAGLPAGVFLDSSGGTAVKLSDIAAVSIDGNSYATSYSEGKIVFPGEAGSTVDLSGSALSALFGDTVSFGDGSTAAGAVSAGTDAKFTINGFETSRSSNTFTIDGLTITATQVSEDATVIQTGRDIDKIVDAVKSFVNDYNKLVKELYGDITEDSEYRNYAPLTDAQEEEMSESEIEKWNEKAQTGLLRNDTYLSTFLQSMRSAFYTKVDQAGVAAYSIGIETTENDYAGQLTLDETALRNAIASDPDAVSKLFTDSESGLSAMIAGACDATAKKSAASPGTLVQLAGADGWTVNAKTNEMYLELSKINDKLDDLQEKYEDERERYWNKFNTMESVIAQYNAQSAMLTSSFSSGS